MRSLLIGGTVGGAVGGTVGLECKDCTNRGRLGRRRRPRRGGSSDEADNCTSTVRRQFEPLPTTTKAEFHRIHTISTTTDSCASRIRLIVLVVWERQRVNEHKAKWQLQVLNVWGNTPTIGLETTQNPTAAARSRCATIDTIRILPKRPTRPLVAIKHILVNSLVVFLFHIHKSVSFKAHSWLASREPSIRTWEKCNSADFRQDPHGSVYQSPHPVGSHRDHRCVRQW